MLAEILKVFVNTLIATDKYPVQHCENFQLQIQMQFSEKRQIFFRFFASFLKSTSNFQHYDQKDNFHS